VGLAIMTSIPSQHLASVALIIHQLSVWKQMIRWRLR